MAKNQELDVLRKKVQILEDKEALHDILCRYAFTVDMCRYDDFVAMWTEDGLFITDGPGTTVVKQGKDEIKSYLVGLLPKSHAGTQHLQLDYVIEVDGDTAKATGYQLISKSEPEKSSIARCALRTFVFNRVNGTWLIKEAISRSITNDTECQKLIPNDRK